MKRREAEANAAAKEQKENEIAANGGLFANAKGGDSALKKLASEESE